MRWRGRENLKKINLFVFCGRKMRRAFEHDDAACPTISAAAPKRNGRHYVVADRAKIAPVRGIDGDGFYKVGFELNGRHFTLRFAELKFRAALEKERVFASRLPFKRRRGRSMKVRPILRSSRNRQKRNALCQVQNNFVGSKRVPPMCGIANQKHHRRSWPHGPRGCPQEPLKLFAPQVDCRFVAQF